MLKGLSTNIAPTASQGGPVGACWKPIGDSPVGGPSETHLLEAHRRLHGIPREGSLRAITTRRAREPEPDNGFATQRDRG